jgi:hypothetical protein
MPPCIYWPQTAGFDRAHPAENAITSAWGCWTSSSRDAGMKRLIRKFLWFEERATHDSVNPVLPGKRDGPASGNEGFEPNVGRSLDPLLRLSLSSIGSFAELDKSEVAVRSRSGITRFLRYTRLDLPIIMRPVVALPAASSDLVAREKVSVQRRWLRLKPR